MYYALSCENVETVIDVSMYVKTVSSLVTDR